MSNTNHYSLYDDLTQLIDGVPAADLVRYLVKEVGHDVCEAKRNSQTSYRFVGRARDIYNELSGTINNSQRTTDNWEDYRRKIDLIEPLEQLLFDFSLVAEEEAFDSSPRVAIQDWIDSVVTWETNRNKIRNLLEDEALSGNNPEWNRDSAALHKYDDISWLSSVTDSIAKSSNVIARVFEEELHRKADPTWGRADLTTLVLPNINMAHSHLQDKVSIEEPAMVLTVRCVMVLEGVLQFSGSRNMENDEKLWAQYLLSKLVWDKAAKILEKLVAYLAGPPDVEALQDLLKDWSEFEEFLKKPPPALEIPLPPLDSIISLIHQIRRPFRARAVALVQLCDQLRRIASVEDDFEALQKAIEDVQDALEAAQRPSFEYASLAWADVEALEASDKIETATESLKESFAIYGGDDEVDQIIENAKQQDEKMVVLLERRASRALNRPRNPRGGLTSVNIISASGEYDDLQLEVGSEETIQLILWKYLSQTHRTLAELPKLYKADPNADPTIRPLVGNLKFKDIGFDRLSVPVLYISFRAPRAEEAEWQQL